MNDKVSRTVNKHLQKVLKPRNPMWDAEIMRKGGVHTPKRDKHVKRQVQDELEEDEVEGMGLPENDPSYEHYLQHKYGDKEGTCQDDGFDWEDQVVDDWNNRLINQLDEVTHM